MRPFFYACAGALCAMTATGAPPAPVTFQKDVLPILQGNCQSCHRPGQVAPMSFLTYKDVRPWAKSIKAAVAVRKMPPWDPTPPELEGASGRVSSVTSTLDFVVEML